MLKLALLVGSVLVAASLGAQSVVPGFTLDTVQDPVAQARALAFAPDGRLFYTEFATGQIRVITTPTTTPTLLMNLSSDFRSCAPCFSVARPHWGNGNSHSNGKVRASTPCHSRKMSAGKQPV